MRWPIARSALARAFARTAGAIAALVTAALSPRTVMVALLVAGVALVAEAVRQLAGSAYALIAWGAACILMAALIGRGLARVE